MSWRDHKGKLAAVAGTVLLVAFFLWCAPAPPPVRLTFLHLTNSAVNGRMAAFAVANVSAKTMISLGIYLRPADESDRSQSIWEWQQPGELRSRFDARTTNTFHTVLISTNGGPQRLELIYLPESKLTNQFNNNVRARLVRMVSFWLPASDETRMRRAGLSIAKSQVFEVPATNPPPPALR